MLGVLWCFAALFFCQAFSIPCRWVGPGHLTVLIEARANVVEVNHPTVLLICYGLKSHSFGLRGSSHGVHSMNPTKAEHGKVMQRFLFAEGWELLDVSCR